MLALAPSDRATCCTCSRRWSWSACADRRNNRGVTSGLFETSTHLGGALSVSTYALLISATDSVRPAYAAGSVLVATGAVVVLAVLHRAPTPAPL